MFMHQGSGKHFSGPPAQIALPGAPVPAAVADPPTAPPEQVSPTEIEHYKAIIVSEPEALQQT